MRLPPAASFPFPCLLADIGGTNARFALVRSAGERLSPMLRLQTTGEADFAATIRKAIIAGNFPAPRSALIAVAGPVVERRATLSNAATASGAIFIDGPALVEQIGLEQGLLFNDFEALCLALPFLTAESVMTLGAGSAHPAGPMVVAGPGTGLGVGGLLRYADAWLPVASEGGHVGIGPETAEEQRIWPHLGGGMISAEDVLSGRGLSRLYRAVALAAETSVEIDTPAAITERALSGADALAEKTISLFFGLLARFTGDMALMFCATGGIFVGGGIAPRFAGTHWLMDGMFASAARDRGRASGFLASIPIQLITAPDAALQGLAAITANPSRFLLDFGARLWR
jgi:glucokinase